MDGDVFGKVGRLGRHAAEAVHRALNGGKWDPFHASKCLEVVLARSGGLPSLGVVQAELRGLRAVPLLATVLRDGTLERIREATLGSGCSLLDLMLRSVSERAILRGEFGTRAVLKRFCSEVLERQVLSGRGGFLEQHGATRINEARALLEPIAAAGASVLDARPDAKRLRLAHSFANITAETDLLGGP